MAIAYVADRGSATFTAHTGTKTFSLASNATAGNALTLCFSATNGSPGTITSITDTKGNTWTLHVQASNLGLGCSIAQTPQNGGALTTGDTISIVVSSPTTPNDVSVLVQEWSGMSTTVGSGARDTTSSGSNPINTNLSAGSAATSNAADLSLCVYQVNATGRTFTADASWTVPTANTVTFASSEQFVQYRILAATGTYGPVGTVSGASGVWISGVQVFLKAQPGPVPTINVSPVASGTTVVGSVLSTDDGTWTNTPTSFAYRWQRDVFGNGVYSNIASGATASTYTLVDADDGCNLRCNVTASNANGPSTAAPSNSLGLITEPVPVNSVSPSLTGSTINGATLSCSTGTWSGMAGHGATFARQWQSAADALFTAGITNLGTASTQVLTSSEVGEWIRCTVTATNDAGNTAKASNIVGPVTSAPVNTVAPVIAGTTVVGQVLTTDDGTWDFSPTAISYAWQRDAFGNSVYSNITSANAAAYTLVNADDACHVRCRVTATNASGSSTATSNVLGLVTEPLPVSSVAPVVTGTPAQGQVLTTSTGSWLNMGGHTPTFTFQWQRDVYSFGAYTNIGSATSSTYTLVSADRSCHVRCVVTAHNTGGTATANSTTLRPVYVGVLRDVFPGAPIHFTAVSLTPITLTAISATPNLCTNGSFENGTTTWVQGANMAGFTVVLGGAFDTHRAKLVTAASAGNRYIRFPIVRTSAANSLVVTFWAIADATTPVVNLDVSIFNIVTGGLTRITDQDWTKVTLFAAAADIGATLSGSVFLRDDSDGSAANTYYIDGVKIEESSIPTPQLLTPIVHPPLIFTDAHLG